MATKIADDFDAIRAKMEEHRRERQIALNPPLELQKSPVRTLGDYVRELYSTKDSGMIMRPLKQYTVGEYVEIFSKTRDKIDAAFEIHFPLKSD